MFCILTYLRSLKWSLLLKNMLKCVFYNKYPDFSVRKWTKPNRYSNDNTIRGGSNLNLLQIYNSSTVFLPP